PIFFGGVHFTRRRRWRIGRTLVAALLIGAGNHGLRLPATEDEERCPAERARFLQRLLPKFEIALDGCLVVIGTSIKGLSTFLPRPNLADVAPALPTWNAQRHGLGVLAGGVPSTGEKFSVATAADDHRFPAFIAHEVRFPGLGPIPIRAQVSRVFT